MRQFGFILVALVLWPSLAATSGRGTVVMFNDLLGEVDHNEAIPWTAPNFENQDSALGYNKEDFGIPKGLEDRVAFWIDIYTKFSTDQGIIHDSRYLHLIYETVDFRDIMKREDISLQQKRRLRSRRVKDLKKQVKARIQRLSKVKSPEGLEGDDLRYWYMFAKIEGSRKFREARSRHRIRFQLGQSDRFIKGIYYSGRFLPEMERIFREEGLPVELTRLPFVESSFNVKARSKVGASGIWQFMRSTARRRLRMNASADERNEPIMATRAAAKFLRNNYEMLNSWPLAITGYNHGPYGVRRMVRRYKTDKITELVDERRGRFGFASANFYASFLAAVAVERRAKEFYGPIVRAKPLQGELIKLSKSINIGTLVSWFDGDRERAEVYNPHLRRSVWKGQRLIQRRNSIRVPQEKVALARQSMTSLPKQKVSAKGETYTVSRGDTISEIAREYGVSIQSILDENGIDSARRIRPGQKLIIPKR